MLGLAFMGWNEMKNFRSLKNWLTVCIVAVATIVSAHAGAKAHEIDFGLLTVEHPWAQPAKAGNSTRLYLVITNEGPSSVYFTGLKTPVASEASIIVQLEPGVERSLDSITMQAGETLNFGTSHMWIALQNLRRNLNQGDSFPAALEFGGDRQVLVIVTVGKVH